MSSDSETDDEEDNDYYQFVMHYDVDAEYLEARDPSADDDEGVVVVRDGGILNSHFKNRYIFCIL